MQGTEKALNSLRQLLRGLENKEIPDLSVHIFLLTFMSYPFFLIFIFYILFIYFLIFFCFNWRLITLQYCGGFCHTFTLISHGCTCVPHPEPSSQCTSPEHPVSCIKPGLMIYFTYDNIYVSMLFSQIVPPSPSPTESKSLFFTDF